MTELRCHICGTTEPWGRDPKDLKEGEHCATPRCPGRLTPPNKRDLDGELAAHRKRMHGRMGQVINNMEE